MYIVHVQCTCCFKNSLTITNISLNETANCQTVSYIIYIICLCVHLSRLVLGMSVNF